MLSFRKVSIPITLDPHITRYRIITGHLMFSLSNHFLNFPPMTSFLHKSKRARDISTYFDKYTENGPIKNKG